MPEQNLPNNNGGGGGGYEELLAGATTTAQGLYLTELGAFDDDPAADDVYAFALKTNNNTMVLDQTVERTNDTFLNMQQLRSKGLLGRVVYGGRLGVDDNAADNGGGGP